ncbi:MAG: DUF4956 domain-containing protein [Gemmatimonadota bacterium]|nr:DUF4956 domain-containing protein [Gemmatimonadota bacterium]
MDELIREMLQSTSAGGGFQLWEAMLALGLSFFLCLIVAYFYRETHQGLSYSVAFVHTMVIMGVTVAIVMLIIGSNIARAFALVGALSIIRFRNAVKDSRDVAFIFITMAIGMAAGTGFYLAAVVFTVFISAMVYFLYRFNIGAITAREVLIRLHLPDGKDHQTAFDSIFLKHLRGHSLLSIETVGEGDLLELVYSAELQRGADERQLLEDLRTVTGGNKVSLLPGHDNVTV